MAPNPKHYSHHLDHDDAEAETSHSEAKQQQQPQQQQQQQQQSKAPARKRNGLFSGRKRGGDIRQYIPPYLRQFVKPYHGDFCYSPIFHPVLVGQLMVEGFLTIACPDYLLPKLHEHRCVIDLRNNGESLHISKSTKKKAGRFEFTVNQAFDQVVEGCHQQHGQSCWLYQPLVQAFQVINQKTISNASGFQTKLVDEKQQQRHTCNLRLYSIEVWNKETGELAGGELGYSVGSIYTSLTGFSAEDSAGSVQLAALGSLLCQQGFTLWDLGMEMEYKTKLGSALMPRDDFVEIVHSVRETRGHLNLSGVDRISCKEIIQAGKSGVSNDSHENLQNKNNKHPVAPGSGNSGQPASPVKKARPAGSS